MSYGHSRIQHHSISWFCCVLSPWDPLHSAAVWGGDEIEALQWTVLWTRIVNDVHASFLLILGWPELIILSYL